MLSAMALVTGSFGAGAAWVLLKLIALFTNLAYFHVLSTAPYDLAQARLGPLSILIPVAGGLIVGLMARFGSDKIRAWNSRSPRSDPDRTKPYCAQSCISQTAVFSDCDWHRRPLRG